MLSFHLFGSVVLFKNGQPLRQFRSQKEAALLIYLAQTGQTQTREFMAELLWEGRSTQQALTNLRTVLARLHKQVGDALLITRQTLALAPESRQQVDAVLLLQQLAAVGSLDSSAQASALQTALNAYHGDFLADFALPDASQFDAWALATRTHIRQQVLIAYRKLGQYALTTGDVELGIATAQRWLQVDKLDEAAHTLLIQLLLASGDVRQAVVHYDHCAELLRAELGVAPPEEMKILIRDIGAKRATPSDPPSDHSASPQTTTPQATIRRTAPATPHNIPPFHDQFVDRATIQQELQARLDQPWCRLVTLVGLGGVGKTRLATTIARSRLNRYADGAWFIDLTEIDGDDENVAEAIVIEIATALDLRLSGAQTPTEQLLSHLQHKQMLLVLDNFEHLLAGVQIVPDILRRCEKVQLLVTSREALQLQAEWAVVLGGLRYPTSDSDEMPSDAVELFRVRQRQNGWTAQQWETMTNADLTAVRTICRMVEGLPLAIELAAALTSHTSVRVIANSLRDGFAVLTTSLRDMPQRHRGLHIVFEMSWRTLNPPLQQRLARLSVFRGGFTKTAALQIADADGEQLATLGAKSLLMYHPATDRYTLHAVIQAYAAVKWASRPGGTRSHPSTSSGRAASDPILQKHAHYYLTLLAQQSAALQKSAPQVAVALLQPDSDNLYLAWQTGLTHPKLVEGCVPVASTSSATDLLLAALPALSIYYQLRGLAYEGEAVMQNTVNAATAWEADGDALAARAGLERARFQNRLGRYRLAIESVAVALIHANRCADRWAEGMGHVLWGEALWRLGEYELATTKLTHARTIAHALNSTLLVGWCHHHLGIIHDIQSRYPAALDHLQQACAAWRTIDNAQALSNSLNSIGLVYFHRGNLPAAQQAMEQALTLCNQLDNRHLQTLLLNNLSMIATEQSDYVSAHHYLELGLALATTSGNLTGQGEIYTSLGKNYRLLGKTGLAIESLEEGVQISESIGNRTLMATALFYLAETSREADLKRAESLYRQALGIARQDNLQSIECGVLIGMAEFLSKDNKSEASQYSAQAVAQAEALQNPALLKRATAINHYLSIA